MFSMKNYSAALFLFVCIGVIISSGCGQPSSHTCTISTGRGGGINVIVVVNGQTRPGSQTTDSNGNVTVTVPSSTPCSSVTTTATS